MKKKILNNWGLKLGSLVLAFVIWFLVVQIDDPKESKTFSGIPVVMTNTQLLDQQNKVYAVLENTDTIRVTVRAPQSVIDNLRASDIVAEADMSKLTEINTIVISLRVLNNDVDSIRCNPDVLKLSVEDRSSKWISVRYGSVGEVAEGYMVANVQPDQTRIEVSGPASAVEQISYASVEIDVTGATTDVSANVEISLYNSEGNLLDLPGVTKNMNYVRMAAEVLATKDVPIVLNTMGTPAAGFLATGAVESDHTSVKLAGSAADLANINSISIPAEELNISGAESNVTATINIKDYLPQNIRLADSDFNGRITATVYIEPEVNKVLEIDLSKVSVVNVPAGLEVQLPENTERNYELRVFGLEAAISLLQEDTVIGTVDIAAWMKKENMEELAPGVYSVPVSFNLSDDIKIENPMYIRVTVVDLED